MYSLYSCLCLFWLGRLCAQIKYESLSSVSFHWQDCFSLLPILLELDTSFSFNSASEHFLFRGNHCHVAISGWRSPGSLSFTGDVDCHGIRLHNTYLPFMPLPLESSQGLLTQSSCVNILPAVCSLNQELCLHQRTGLPLKYWTRSSRIPSVN